jgi:hypothetical protein
MNRSLLSHPHKTYKYTLRAKRIIYLKYTWW